MKLHASVIQKLLRIYELHGGRRENTKLLAELSNIDLTAYTQKENPAQDQFLVLTEDIKKAIDASNR